MINLCCILFILLNWRSESVCISQSGQQPFIAVDSFLILIAILLKQLPYSCHDFHGNVFSHHSQNCCLSLPKYTDRLISIKFCFCVLEFIIQNKIKSSFTLFYYLRHCFAHLIEVSWRYYDVIIFRVLL